MEGPGSGGGWRVWFTRQQERDQAHVICNRCPCCCTILRGKTQLHHPHAFEPSRFVSHVNSHECTGCGICADERCPMKAIEIKNNRQRRCCELHRLRALRDGLPGWGC